MAIIVDALYSDKLLVLPAIMAAIMIMMILLLCPSVSFVLFYRRLTINGNRPCYFLTHCAATYIDSNDSYVDRILMAVITQ